MGELPTMAGTRTYSKLAAQPERAKLTPSRSQPPLTTADRVRLSLLLTPPRR